MVDHLCTRRRFTTNLLETVDCGQESCGSKIAELEGGFLLVSRFICSVYG